MNNFAITVVGHDRPGIIASVTQALAEHGGNIEDSTMTLLQGHFAWTLVVAVDASRDEINESVDSLRSEELAITVLLVPLEDSANQGQFVRYWVNVHGSDHQGIVAALTRVLADHEGNITNLTTRLVSDLYVLSIEVDMPYEVESSGVDVALEEKATELGVSVSIVAADEDIL